MITLKDFKLQESDTDTDLIGHSCKIGDKFGKIIDVKDGIIILKFEDGTETELPVETVFENIINKTNKTNMIKILDYSQFKKIFESKINEDSDELIKISKEIENTLSKIDLSDSDIKSEIAEVMGEKIEDIDLPEKIEESLNEALLTLAGIALSAGKVAEMLGKGVKWSGKKLNVKGIENVGEWLAKGGHKYTHAIEEKLVKPALLLIPSFKSASKETQDKITKYVLIGVIGSLAAVSGFELIHAVKEGHGLMTALEGTLVSAKAHELSQLVGEVVGDVISDIN